MTLRQYAAIHLKVPDSGEEWLDEMIRESLRDEAMRQAYPPVPVHQDMTTRERDDD